MENEKSVFDLHLNEKGRHWVQRLCSLIRVMIAFFIMFTCINIAYMLKFEILPAIRMHMSVWTVFRSWPHVPLYFLILVTGILSVYNLSLFSKKYRLALQKFDTDEFNGSFKYIVRFLAFCLFNILTEALLLLFYVIR